MRNLLVLLALLSQGLFSFNDVLAASVASLGVELRVASPPPSIGTFYARGARGGFTYEVLASRDLKSWEVINTQVASPSGQFDISVPVLTDDPVRFFRVRESGETLVISSDPETPPYQIAAAGSIGVTASIFKLRMPVSDGELLALPIKLTSGSPQSIFQVTFWDGGTDGGTQVGWATFFGDSKKQLAYFSKAFLKGGTDNRLVVKIDPSTLGPQGAAISGDLITVDYDDDPAPGMGAQVVISRTAERIAVSGNTHSGGVRLFKSYPTLTLIPLPASGVSDGRLLRFSVSASSLGAIALGKMQVDVNANGANISDMNVFAYNDPSYSQPVSGVGSGGKLLRTDGSSGQLVVGLSIPVVPQTVSGNETSVQVASGGKVYFEVRANITPASSNYYVVTRILGDRDAAPIGPLLLQQAVGKFSVAVGNFMWSPNSRTVSSLIDTDWVNGYGLVGLPSDGITQVRTN